MFFSGSSSYIPSTLVPFKITSDSISIALSTAAESVVKYGFPVPPPKITTLPFSKCLIAFLLIKGSATSLISIAVWSLVGAPEFFKHFVKQGHLSQLLAYPYDLLGLYRFYGHHC